MFVCFLLISRRRHSYRKHPQRIYGSFAVWLFGRICRHHEYSAEVVSTSCRLCNLRLWGELLMIIYRWWSRALVSLVQMKGEIQWDRSSFDWLKVGRMNTALRARVSPDRICVIPNAVEFAMFTPPSQPRQGSDIIIIVLCRLMYRKGLDLLAQVS